MNETDGDNGHQSVKIICCGCNKSMSEEPSLCVCCRKAAVCLRCCPLDSIVINPTSSMWSWNSCLRLSIHSLLTSIANKLNIVDDIQSEVLLLQDEFKQMSRQNEQTSLDEVFNLWFCQGKKKCRDIERNTNAFYSEKWKTQILQKKLFHMNIHRRNSFIVSTGANNKKRKREVRQIEVVQGNKSNNNSRFKGLKPVEPKPPRNHYFLSRVDNSVDISILVEYCIAHNLDALLGSREIPCRSSDQKSFHLVFPANKTDLVESSDTWPENIVLRRYFFRWWGLFITQNSERWSICGKLTTKTYLWVSMECKVFEKQTWNFINNFSGKWFIISCGHGNTVFRIYRFSWKNFRWKKLLWLSYQ